MASPQLPQTHQDEPMVDAAPLSSKRPNLASPCKKRKLSDSDSEAASPTSMDEVDPAAPEESAISPKKKARAEADPNKWECLTSSVDLAEEPKEDSEDKQQQQYEPIAFSDAPAQLSDEELCIFQFFMGA